MRYAVEHDYSILATMDADGSHDPATLSDLLAGTATSDVVIGSRYIPGGKIVGWPLRRRVISRGLNAISCRLLRLPIHDASGAFRAYRVQLLARLDFDRVRATGYSYLEEVLWHLARAGATFSEVPITFRDRRAGQSKADWTEAWGKIATLARLAVGR
jgi:dolichol-phosphate mannosyltransferase